MPGQDIINKSAADRIRREQDERRCAERFDSCCFYLGQRMPRRDNQLKGIVVQDRGGHARILSDQIADSDIDQSALHLLINL
ncbi:hypothetical protein D3C80_1865730 [compost metagenome]